jgi:hypothetical protein
MQAISQSLKSMKEVTAEYLRDMVVEAITPSIETYRASRLSSDEENYTPPTGLPTDEEIDDFLFHNALLDEEIGLIRVC